MTFMELKKRYDDAVARRTVVDHLIEYLDGNFLNSGAGSAKQVMVTNEQVQVTQETFSEISAWLNEEARRLERIEAEASASVVVENAPVAGPTQGG